MNALDRLWALGLAGLCLAAWMVLLLDVYGAFVLMRANAAVLVRAAIGLFA